MMHNFKELKVWNKAADMAVEVYGITKSLPSEEKFGLTSQINRSAVSVPANIAEGAVRNTNGEFNQFLGIATGSLYELETLLIISAKIGVLQTERMQSISPQIEEVSRMISGLKNSLFKQ
jgi:four helix bundle protein